jgi:ergothioneine biosynthesis protein EgtB
MTDFPTDAAGIAAALVSQRQYTRDLYAGLPQAYWQASAFPFMKIVNPPLWELAHIAWFAEFFCLRWQSDDQKGRNTPSRLRGSDALFDSAAVPHAERWRNTYPPREACFDYMQEVLDALLAQLDVRADDQLYPFRLAVAHEDMHAEALVMTLRTVGLPMPSCVPAPTPVAGEIRDMQFGEDTILLGDSGRVFRFDNELPACLTRVAPFAIASRVVLASEFAEFHESAAYRDDRLWSEAGAAWRRAEDLRAAPRDSTGHADLPAVHVSFYQAEAWCRWAGRRLPTEAEWELAAVRSADFRRSTGLVWEWTDSSFTGYPGFEPGRYHDYSLPWFGDHKVLRGGSFVTNARLKYPQYRNFYLPERHDMFCGFRTCPLPF